MREQREEKGTPNIRSIDMFFLEDLFAMGASVGADAKLNQVAEIR